MYEKNSWQNGDVITKSKLDHAEDGIYAASFIPQADGIGPTVTLDPNVFFVFDEVATLNVSFTAGTAGQVNEYHFAFTSGSTPTVLSLPVDVVMPDYFAVVADNYYEISIVNNYGVFNSWPVESEGA